ncbi:MAG: DUF2057 family protein [Solimonas sp.]
MSYLSRILAATALLSLAACATPNVRLYDGPAKSAGEVAVITMPEQLEVSSINSVEVPSAQGMWNRGDKRLEVVPGRYEALVFYREVWNPSGESDVVRSKNPALFVIDAQAGHEYRLGYERPGSANDAKALAQNFHGYFVDKNTGKRTASQESGVKFADGFVAQLMGDKTLVPATDKGSNGSFSVQSVLPMPIDGSKPVPVAPLPDAAVSSVATSGATPSVVKAAPVSASPPPAVAPVAAIPVAPVVAAVPAPSVPQASKPASGDRDWLSLMKGWWKQASVDERRSFLRWVGDGDSKALSGSDWLGTMKGWWDRAGAPERRELLRWVGEQP